MARQHRKFTQNQRQFDIPWSIEREANPAAVLHDRFGDVGIVGGIERQTALAQGFETPDHIVRRDRCAIVPARFGAQVESDPGVVLRKPHAVGQQSVGRGRLVIRGFQQGVVEP